MATEIITSSDQQCDASGDPISGAEIIVYDVGTTTPQNLFSDTALTVTAANPIICDSSGRHDMRYKAVGSYKIMVKTAGSPAGAFNGTTVYTRDGIDGRVPVGSGALAIANGGTGATSAAAALTALGGATAAQLASLASDVASLSGTLSSSEKTHIATGTTAQRPTAPAEGDIRRNTTSVAQWEGYNGSAWDRFATPVATFTTQYLLSGTAATYTLPTGCKAIVVKMRAGGGGGGAAATNSGAVGGTTTFNSVDVTGGAAGLLGSSGTGGLGGTGGSGSASFRLQGSDGVQGIGLTGVAGQGGNGGGPGGGRGGYNGVAGTAGKANTGGGGGGGATTSASVAGGGGGGAGEYAEIVITSPSATYTYTVGAGGAGGAAGTFAGGAGGTGVIVVEEYYR